MYASNMSQTLFEQGGCTAEMHRIARGLPLVLPPIHSDATATVLSLDSVDPTPLQPCAAPAAVLPVPQPLDARQDPCFASHLLPIYVESLAQEQSLELAKSKLNAKRIASAKQAAEKVTVHAWKPLTTEPESQLIQKGFTWPFFKLSPPILSMIGLQDSADSGALQVYDETEGYWVAVDIDHVIEVGEGQHIFLQDRSVTVYHHFDTLSKQASHPHLHNNLPQECAYVRNAWRALAPHSTSLATSPPPDPFPSPDKCERTLSMVSTISPCLTPIVITPPALLTPDPSADPSATPAEEPVELGNGEEKRWPKDYHVCDPAPCFCDAKTSICGPHTRTAATVFREHFPHLPFHLSTFSDNKAIWRKAPQALRSHYLCAGRRQAGIWSKFAADVKGLEKVQVSSSSEVIELSE